MKRACRLFPTLAALLLAAWLAGCGGGEDSPAVSSSEAEAAQSQSIPEETPSSLPEVPAETAILREAQLSAETESVVQLLTGDSAKLYEFSAPGAGSVRFTLWQLTDDSRWQRLSGWASGSTAESAQTGRIALLGGDLRQAQVALQAENGVSRSTTGAAAAAEGGFGISYLSGETEAPLGQPLALALQYHGGDSLSVYPPERFSRPDLLADEGYAEVYALTVTFQPGPLDAPAAAGETEPEFYQPNAL